MIRFAPMNAPLAEFVVGDVRSFGLASVYHGAVSTYDCHNHIMTHQDLVMSMLS